jgi:hypothetical protein
MDERKLGELFNEAVPDAPPPSFGMGDVVIESARQTQRKRNALLGGSALGIALLAGVTALGVALWSGTDNSDGLASANSAPGVATNGNGAPGSNETLNEDSQRSAGGGASNPNFPPEAPKQGGPPTGNAGPIGPGSTLNGCGQAAPELAAALAGELRAVALPDPVPAALACPEGTRAASFPLSENGRTGTLTVLVVPVGQTFASPPGATIGIAKAADGRQFYALSVSSGGSSSGPYASEVQNIARLLAERY